MKFQKNGSVLRNLKFYYDGQEIETTRKTLATQAQKVIFRSNKYLYKFTYIKPKHVLGLFEKLVAPILNHGSEV